MPADRAENDRSRSPRRNPQGSGDQQPRPAPRQSTNEKAEALSQRAVCAFKHAKDAVVPDDAALNKKCDDYQEAIRLWEEAARALASNSRDKSGPSYWSNLRVFRKNQLKAHTHLALVLVELGRPVPQRRFHVCEAARLLQYFNDQTDASLLYSWFATTVRDGCSSFEDRMQLLRAFLHSVDEVLLSASPSSSASITGVVPMLRTVRTQAAHEIAERLAQRAHKKLESLDLSRVRWWFDDEEMLELAEVDRLTQELCRVLAEEVQRPRATPSSSSSSEINFFNVEAMVEYTIELIADAKFLSHRVTSSKSLAKAARDMRQAQLAADSDGVDALLDTMDDLKYAVQVAQKHPDMHSVFSMQVTSAQAGSASEAGSPPPASSTTTASYTMDTEMVCLSLNFLARAYALLGNGSQAVEQHRKTVQLALTLDPDTHWDYGELVTSDVVQKIRDRENERKEKMRRIRIPMEKMAKANRSKQQLVDWLTENYPVPVVGGNGENTANGNGNANVDTNSRATTVTTAPASRTRNVENKRGFLKVVRDYSPDKQTEERVPDGWLPDDWKLFTTEISKALNQYYEAEYCGRPPVEQMEEGEDGAGGEE